MYRFSVWRLKSCKNYQNNRNTIHDDCTPFQKWQYKHENMTTQFEGFVRVICTKNMILGNNENIRT